MEIFVFGGIYIKMSKSTAESIAFYLILFLLLLPVFVCNFIVTGDGPCHFYNSNILVSWLFEGKEEFYQPFYMLNPNPDPNWITNAIQIPLLILFSPMWAEKIFFALYILCFSFGFKKVIREINPQSVFLSCIGILFAWNNILLKGFTNNSWSMALWLWVLAFWLMSMRTKRPFLNWVLAVTFIALIFSHPVGYILSLISVACIILSYGFFTYRLHGIKKVFKYYLEEGFRLFVLSLFSNFLLLFFFLRKEWSPNNVSIQWTSIANDLLHLKALVTLRHEESNLILGIMVIILGLLMIGIWNRIKSKLMTPYEGFLLFFLISLWITLDPPESFSGGLEIGVRLGLIPAMALLFWLATHHFQRNIRYVTLVLVFLIAVALTYIRLPVQVSASRYAEEVLTCKDSIADQSTLLVLNYDWNGKPVGDEIMPDRNWLFNHVDCYLGTYKDLIISDNYEANFWYFPLIEKWETNMYKQTDKDGINFDHRPPRADINNYNRRTGGQNIDYVLLLSYSEEYENHPYTVEIFDQLASTYQKVFTSEHERAILYKRIKY